MNKKTRNIILLILAVALCVIVVLKLAGNEDDWLCVNGQWIKHGQPSAPMPPGGCGENKNNIASTSTLNDNKSGQNFSDQNSAGDIVIIKPSTDEIIFSPLSIAGEAKGSYYFEGSFPIKLEDADGNLVATTTAQAQSEWTTENFVPFKAVVEFPNSFTGNGQLVLENDNPSGLPQNAKRIKVPVKFGGQ
jgi:hypothetical protein